MKINDILKEINQLSDKEQNLIKNLLQQNIINDHSLEDVITNERFKNGRVCPNCSSVEKIVRFGKTKGGVQRYKCNNCGQTFVASTNSVISKTHYGLDVWEKYIECMLQGLSVRKSAEICGIHRNTAFIWRHKILDALTELIEKDTKLKGIIEADETFFNVSYKGNHSKSNFELPRAPKHRGTPATKRGLSREKVCVSCAIDRNGKSFSKIAALGRLNEETLEIVYKGRLKKKSVLCTDSLNAYIAFAQMSDLKLVQLKGGRVKNGIYHIQHINSYHSRLKKLSEGLMEFPQNI